MTKLEIIMDLYPELKFYFIEVNNTHYHGDIDGNCIFINVLQPDYDWLRTALHEATHHENDIGECTDTKNIKVLRSEKWAMREASVKYRTLFG